ncbi:MAG: hypothetical protein AAF483_00055 [Planctomycetota bacterium]
MNLLGKVFIGLIFLLSITFFTYAVMMNASHIDHNAVASSYSAEAQISEARNQQLEALLQTYTTELNNELASRREALAALQIQVEDANAAYLAKEKEASDLRAALTTVAQNNETAHADMRQKADTNRNLREQIATTKQQRDELYQKLIDAKAAYNGFQGTLRSLQDRATDLGN